MRIRAALSAAASSSAALSAAPPPSPRPPVERASGVCEAWGYGAENLLNCYGSIRGMTNNLNHACWAELDSRPTCCGYCMAVGRQRRWLAVGRVQ